MVRTGTSSGHRRRDQSQEAGRTATAGTRRDIVSAKRLTDEGSQRDAPEAGGFQG